jgi:hypothetical protein
MRLDEIKTISTQEYLDEIVGSGWSVVGPRKDPEKDLRFAKRRLPNCPPESLNPGPSTDVQGRRTTHSVHQKSVYTYLWENRDPPLCFLEGRQNGPVGFYFHKTVGVGLSVT